MTFNCSECGTNHDISDLSFGAASPLQWDLLSDDERAQSSLSGEQCEIQCSEGASFYVRACLEIPIINMGRVFTWGVWCSLSETSYSEMSEHWNDPERIKLGPYFGWLCTQIPGYVDTAFLKSMVHQREVGTRPLVLLEETSHPLSVDQRDGIEEERVKALVMRLMH